MQRTQLRFTSIALLLAFSSWDTAASWERIAETPAGDVYVDRTTLKQMGGLATMVAVTNLRPPPSASAPTLAFQSIAQVDDFDCAAKRIRLSGFILFAGPMATGEKLLTSAEDKPWSNAEENEWNLRKWQIACNRFNDKQQH